MSKKCKKYDWKDSNMSDVGSKLDRLVKKDSAESEPAWVGTKDKVGTSVWRIENFKVRKVDKKDYGNFFNGDSYIILNGFKSGNGEKIEYDVHFWIGKYSTQDEYGTAAYKTVELDNYLDDLPVQHRQVQDHETNMFTSLFNTFTVLEGGVDSGFRKISVKEYIPRLLHFRGEKRNIIIRQIPRCAKLITHDDVYILDKGSELIQWNGSTCNKDEKMKAMRFIGELKLDRNAKSTVIDDNETDNRSFYGMLDETINVEDKQVIAKIEQCKILYRISDASGAMVVEKVKEGADITSNSIDNDDVFILDTVHEVYVIKGKNANENEKNTGIIRAHEFLKDSSNPYKSISVFDMNLHEGRVATVLG